MPKLNSLDSDHPQIPYHPLLSRPRRRRPLRLLLLVAVIYIAYAQWRQMAWSVGGRAAMSGPATSGVWLDRDRLREDVTTCKVLKEKPKDPVGLGRDRNARFVEGQKATLIVNATVWTGVPLPDDDDADHLKTPCYVWASADILLARGLIVAIAPPGRIPAGLLPDDGADGDNYITYDARGRPLTTGIIDMHSHVGVNPLPMLANNQDYSETSADITPYARAMDGLWPLDPQLRVIASGGVTTSLVLPGSGNNIGGEAFVIKHAVGREGGRPELSVSSMLADPDRNWRYMKMACGENPKSADRPPSSRLGEAWQFRHALDQARSLVRSQDDWCAAAAAAEGDGAAHDRYLPRDRQWESLAAVLRGQVRVNTHCYTVTDLEMFVGLTNEFKFPIQAFHHATEAYMVPEIMKRAWGGKPAAAALFADNFFYKVEAYLGSARAGKMLHDAGITPVYVSDNPVLNAQHLIFEAAKAYRHGLPYHAALAGVTSAPADLLGLGKRLGRVAVGYDADVVVWDSDPLSLGATPVQVWIDGVAQFPDPVELRKDFGKESMMVPDERLADGLAEVELEDVIFTGVSKVLGYDRESADSADSAAGPINVVIRSGKIMCVGRCERDLDAQIPIIHLRNGTLTPAFTIFGSSLGLTAIDAEPDTDNGPSSMFTRAVDGLSLDDRKLRAAYRGGATRAISAPRLRSSSTHHGTSVGFLTGAKTTLDQLGNSSRAVVWGEDVAMHYTVGISAKDWESGDASTAATVGNLRYRLLQALESKKDATADPYYEDAYLGRVIEGEIPLVLTLHSADNIGSALKVKSQVEAAGAKPIRLVILGGAEAHLVAPALAAADVPVVLVPLFSYGTSWDRRRALVGAPLTNGTAIDVLLRAGVRVAAGVDQDYLGADVGALVGWAGANSGGRLDGAGAWALFGASVWDVLGLGGKRQAGHAGAATASSNGVGDDGHSMDDEGEREHFILWDGDATQTGTRIRGVGGGLGKVLGFVEL